MCKMETDKERLRNILDPPKCANCAKGNPKPVPGFIKCIVRTTSTINVLYPDSLCDKWKRIKKD